MRKTTKINLDVFSLSFSFSDSLHIVKNFSLIVISTLNFLWRQSFLALTLELKLSILFWYASSLPFFTCCGISVALFCFPRSEYFFLLSEIVWYKFMHLLFYKQLYLTPLKRDFCSRQGKYRYPDNNRKHHFYTMYFLAFTFPLPMNEWIMNEYVFIYRTYHILSQGGLQF